MSSDSSSSVGNAITQSVNDIIESITPRQITEWKVSSFEKFATKVTAYESFLNNIKSQLASSAVNTHQLLWIECLYKITATFSQLKKTFVKLCMERNVPYHQAALCQIRCHKVLLEIGSLLSVYLSEANLTTFGERFKKVVERIIEILLVKNVTVEVQQNKNETHIEQKTKVEDEILGLLLDNFRYIISTGDNKLSVLAHFSKCLYILNRPALFARILTEYDPEFPLGLLANASPINLVDLIDFYRYTAFNLVSLSFKDTRCFNDSYTKQADLYFKVLFAFPNLNINGAIDGLDTKFPEDSIINLEERQEISYLYILNHIASMNSVIELFNTSPVFKSEITFLIRTMSAELSRDIEEQASQPGSRHSSVLNIPLLDNSKKNSLNQTNSLNSIISVNSVNSVNNLSNSYSFEKSNEEYMEKLSNIGAVIYEGTYKEKLKLVVSFCEAISAAPQNLCIQDMFQNLNEILDYELWSLHQNVEVVYKVRLLLIGLVLKQANQISGFNRIPLSSLGLLFALNNDNNKIEDIISNIYVKGFSWSIDDDSLVFKTDLPNVVPEDMVQTQLEIVRLTNRLKDAL